MQKNRDPSFDAFRGLAIIAVVAIHTFATCFSRRYSIAGEWNFFFLVACRQLLNFAVPAFIFISGYWMAKKPIRSLQDYRAFLIRRLTRVLIPYLFWSSILLGYEAIKTHDIDVQQIIFKLLTGTAISPYFFIILIAQLYVITPLLHYVNRKPYGLILVLIVNVISLLLRYLSKLHFNYWFPSISPFYSWIIFYEIGLLVGRSDNKIFAAKKVRFFILPALLVSLLASELEGMILLLKYNILDFAVSAVKYSSFLYSICIIIAFLHLRKHLSQRPEFLVTIGNYSFGIYLIHIPVLHQVANLVQKSSTIYSFQPLYQFIVVLITISICFVLIRITRELFPKSFCYKILGF